MNNIHEDELDEYIGLALRLSPSHFLPEKYASQSAIPKDVYDIAHKKMKKFLKLELNRLIQSKINEARIDELKIAKHDWYDKITIKDFDTYIAERTAHYAKREA